MLIFLGLNETVLIVVASVIVATVLGILLYFFVISRFKFRKQVSNLEKQFSHCDALLLGQDTQYIHRLEIISRTNLLYLSKYEQFYRRFKSIHDNEDAYADSILKQLKSLLAAKQYKNIKSVISEAKKAVENLTESVNNLDHDLYEVIKLEEDCRRTIDHLREVYRHVKQTYYSESNDLEMVAATFNKMFDKIDASFARFDEQLEGAEYEEINSEAASLNSVLTALGHVLIELPKLCKTIKTDIPEALTSLQNKYKETEKQGVPLYHLSFKNHIEEWKKKIQEISKRIINLQIGGVNSELELILVEIDSMRQKLDDEVTARDYFREHYDFVYQSVNNVEKVFLRICALLPEIKNIYIISPTEIEKIDSLGKSVDDLGNSKRYLDGFVHSGTRQPYSLLKSKLDELEANYSIVNKGVTNFKMYIDSLKSTAEEAYNMISVYYYQVKEAERALDEVNIESFSSLYREKIEAVFEVLNDIYQGVQTKPIDVEDINNKITNLKNIANPMFEDIENKTRNAKVAERSLVILNRDRDEQDINHTVNQLEIGFQKGDFQSVYSQANSLYKNRHLDNEN
ncbi:MAG: hypothetical protein J5955_02255 [Bacilli bacterium]|nr:hypothetical protein [Bacilli bacterium]